MTALDSCLDLFIVQVIGSDGRDVPCCWRSNLFVNVAISSSSHFQILSSLADFAVLFLLRRFY
jgi:hypothetical protein